ncbi:MAG: pilus motility taxis protein HmpF [Elainellaceae cyanobacterium]
MLYLAEVIRKARVIGGGKAEFRLLACQRNELSWSAIPGEEIIPAPDDVTYSTGILVLVDLSATKQVQRHAEAGRQLVSILQNFSRLHEKAKTQEEEIEQWKQSLTYQSQELNRREMEMEARQEQLQQMEEEFERLDQQRQEIESAQEELTRLQQEYERKNQDLEGAWAQIRGAEAKLEERQSELQQASVLDEGQAQHLQELLSRISGAVTPTESIREQLHLTFDLIAQQQNGINHHWQNLEQYQSSAQQLQTEVEQQTQELHNRWQGWHQVFDGLAQVRAELQVKQGNLKLKQDHARTVSIQLQYQQALHQQVMELLGTPSKVDLEVLGTMPLEELQTVAQELERDLEKLSRFVNNQEEELALQQEAIDDLHKQIQQASEYDRLRLETELADEQDRYQMLNETLVGQRRNLHERQSVLKHHQNVLARRQGHPVCEGEIAVDLAPILTQVDQRRQQLGEELQELEQQIQQLQESVQQLQHTVDQDSSRLEAERDELRQFDQQLRSQTAAAAELWGRVNVYRETLQPIQDNLNELKQKTEAIASVMTQFQEASDYQLQALHEMQDTVLQLTTLPTHELAAS